MRAFVLRRLLQFVPVILIASVGVWAMIYALPGNPAEIMAGPNASPAQLAAVRGHLGLDKPVLEQYFNWLGNALHGDLGTAYSSGLPVTKLLLQRIPATAQLALCSIVVGVLVALVIGTVSAIYGHRLLGRLAAAYQNLGLAVPTFWVGILMILVLSIKLKRFPSAGDYVPLWQHPIQALQLVALPALTLGLHVSAITARFVSSALGETLTKDYIRTARAKGVSELAVIWHHGLRNSLLPVVTVVGLQLGTFLGGTVVTEVVFNYPGIGRLIYSAVSTRDYTLVQGGVLFVVFVFLSLNLLVDMLYAYIDPTVRVA